MVTEPRHRILPPIHPTRPFTHEPCLKGLLPFVFSVVQRVNEPVHDTVIEIVPRLVSGSWVRYTGPRGLKIGSLSGIMRGDCLKSPCLAKGSLRNERRRIRSQHQSLPQAQLQTKTHIMLAYSLRNNAVSKNLGVQLQAHYNRDHS